MVKALDLGKKKYGRLTVLGRVVSNRRRGQSFWRCVCTCGKIRTVQGSLLTSGGTRSCGCLQDEARRNRFGDSRKTHRKEYVIWKKMRSRCNSRTDISFPNYGGRGVTICERWNNFDNFLMDMGDRPPGNYSLDRIDNSGNYEPSNCRWATRREQSRNKRNNFKIVYRGKKWIITDLAREVRIPRNTLRRRLEAGWTMNELNKMPRDLRILGNNRRTKRGA